MFVYSTTEEVTKIFKYHTYYYRIESFIKPSQRLIV